MDNRVVITGGSGMVGRQLTLLLLEQGYEVAWLSRSGKAMDGVSDYQWNIESGFIERGAFQNAIAVVHLAGEGIADKKWTASQRKKIMDSRVKSAQLLHETLVAEKIELPTYISASGSGYYGYDNGDRELMEDSGAGSDFVANVVKAWEESADLFEALGTRVVKLRTGVVLSGNGGALEKMSMPIRWGVGSPLGSGRQYVSWIHINDLCRLIVHALKYDQVKGIFNAVSPNPITNKQLTKAIAKSLNRPLFLPNVPSFVLKLLLGEMSNLVLGSGKLSAKKIIDTGFSFEFAELQNALENLLKVR